MLVLTRSVGQAVVIGDGPDAVLVTIERASAAGDVRLGFEAPDHIRIDRLEIHRARAMAAGQMPLFQEAQQ